MKANAVSGLAYLGKGKGKLDEGPSITREGLIAPSEVNTLNMNGSGLLKGQSSNGVAQEGVIETLKSGLGAEQVHFNITVAGCSSGVKEMVKEEGRSWTLEKKLGTTCTTLSSTWSILLSKEIILWMWRKRCLKWLCLKKLR